MLLLTALALSFVGCGQAQTLTSSYPSYDSDFLIGTETANAGTTYTQEKKIAVSEDINSVDPAAVSYPVSDAGGVFNLTTREVSFRQNIFQKVYPASTTKILTALLILEHCDLKDEVTISREAVSIGADSSSCKLAEGDVLTVEQLLNGLILVSGNDAANALAEHCSGSVADFVELMNETAASLGATNSHFVNPHGLPDEDHYTTVYDMYLIFQEALKRDDFRELIAASAYDAVYRDASGGQVTKTWNSTNKYKNGEQEAPEGFTVIGGKTGTTNAAGHCLVLVSQNAMGEEIISIVYRGESTSDLYAQMNALLTNYGQSVTSNSNKSTN